MPALAYDCKPAGGAQVHDVLSGTAEQDGCLIGPDQVTRVDEAIICGKHKTPICHASTGR